MADTLLRSSGMWKCRRLPVYMAFPLAALAAVWPAPPSAAGADLHEARVVTALAGHATASRAGVSRPLRFRDSLVDGDTITTMPPSTLRVLVACKSVVTVRESAAWSIVERSGRAGLNLWEGRLGLTSARQLMSKDDVVQVSTPNALASLRGSSLVIEVQRSGAVDGPAPRDEVLVAPRTSDLRHGNDTALSSARCAARTGGASGIVRESDTGPLAP